MNTKQDLKSDIQDLRRTKLDIERENDPFNELLANDRLLYSFFPLLFLFGHGISSSGSLSEKLTRHLMLQFRGQFAGCHSLIFLIFDQLQRHMLLLLS